MDQKIVDQRNVYVTNGDTTTLTITRNDGEQHDITIDTADLQQVRDHVWRIGTGRGKPHATTGGWKRPQIALSWQVVGKPKRGQIVYHVDRDWTNCRRSNLRHGTRSDMLLNAWSQVTDGSGYVQWHERDQKYYAYGYWNGQQKYIGSFETHEDGMAARERWMRKKKGTK